MLAARFDCDLKDERHGCNRTEDAIGEGEIGLRRSSEFPKGGLRRIRGGSRGRRAGGILIKLRRWSIEILDGDIGRRFLDDLYAWRWCRYGDGGGAFDGWRFGCRYCRGR